MFRPSPLKPLECAELQPITSAFSGCCSKKKCCKKYKKAKRCKSCPGNK